MKICSKTHQIAAIQKKNLRGTYPQTPLANAWLRHASQTAPRHTTCPAPKKLAPLDKSYIRPWTTAKKFI